MMILSMQFCYQLAGLQLAMLKPCNTNIQRTAPGIEIQLLPHLSQSTPLLSSHAPTHTTSSELSVDNNHAEFEIEMVRLV